jgi:hypothetical protein
MAPRPHPSHISQGPSAPSSPRYPSEPTSITSELCQTCRATPDTQRHRLNRQDLGTVFWGLISKASIWGLCLWPSHPDPVISDTLCANPICSTDTHPALHPQEKGRRRPQVMTLNDKATLGENLHGHLPNHFFQSSHLARPAFHNTI